MKKVKLIYGEDSGFCSLWDISLGQYNLFHERIGKAAEDGNYSKVRQLEKELESHRIEVDWNLENGYVPDYVGCIAKLYGIDVESN